MDSRVPFNGSLTREKFLFNEMRITARLMCQCLTDEEIVEAVKGDNLFQYPTEKLVVNLAKVCIKRLHALESDELVEYVADGSSILAKQVCLYAMMQTYRLVWEFMRVVIAQKYKNRDYTYSKKDINVFLGLVYKEEK